jgi:transmembrane sensor
MSFESTSVSEVMTQLNKKFGVQISSEDKDINGYVLNADFTDQSLPSILEMLEKSLNITYIIRDKKIILNKKLNNQSN